jgi:hypothetical protein
MGGGRFHLGPPADGALEATRSATGGSVCAGALELIGPGAIGSAEDAPSPSALSPAGAYGAAVEASIFDASSSPLDTSTSV